MLQRIQTVYLLLAGALAAAAFFLPLTYFSTSTSEVFDIYVTGVKSSSGENVEGSIYMMILAAATIAVPIVNICLFNNRMLQVRICGILGVLLVGNMAMIGAFTYLSVRAFEQIGVTTVGFHPALFAPLVALVFCFLAGRAILRDELVVRSVDRIR